MAVLAHHLAQTADGLLKTLPPGHHKCVPQTIVLGTLKANIACQMGFDVGWCTPLIETHFGGEKDIRHDLKAVYQMVLSIFPELCVSLPVFKLKRNTVSSITEAHERQAQAHGF